MQLQIKRHSEWLMKIVSHTILRYCHVWYRITAGYYNCHKHTRRHLHRQPQIHPISSNIHLFRPGHYYYHLTSPQPPLYRRYGPAALLRQRQPLRNLLQEATVFSVNNHFYGATVFDLHFSQLWFSVTCHRAHACYAVSSDARWFHFLCKVALAQNGGALLAPNEGALFFKQVQPCKEN